MHKSIKMDIDQRRKNLIAFYQKREMKRSLIKFQQESIYRDLLMLDEMDKEILNLHGEIDQLEMKLGDTNAQSD